MPDASGNFKGISVPELPWLKKSDHAWAQTIDHHPTDTCILCGCERMSVEALNPCPRVVRSE